MTIPGGDRIKELSNTSGTGSFVLSGAVAGEPVRAFASSEDGQHIRYVAKHVTAQEAESGYGVYTHSTRTLTRLYRYYPSRGAAAVAFSAGGVHVACTSIVGDMLPNFATVDPTVNDDVTAGFLAGMEWINTVSGEIFKLISHQAGAAVWEQLNAGGNGSVAGHTIQDDGTPLTDRANLNFATGLLAVDDSGNSRTNVSLTSTGVTPGAYTNLNATIGVDGRVTAAASGGASSGLAVFDDAGTAITVDDSLSGTHRQLTSDSAISVTLSANATARNSRVALEKAGAGLVSVSMASGAGYFAPGQDIGDTPATSGLQIVGYMELLCIGYFGQSTTVTDAAWGTPSGSDVTVTSAGSNLPSLVAGQRITVRNHSASANNGDYLVTGTPSASSVDLTKETGDAPQNAAAEAVDIDHGCVYKIYGHDNLDDTLSANLDCAEFDLLNIGSGSTFANASSTRSALGAAPTDSPTFTGIAKFETARLTDRQIGDAATIGATDNGKVLFTTEVGTATVSAASTLCPNAGDAFVCDVVNVAAGSYVLDGPGAVNVTLAQNEIATIVTANGRAIRVVKGLATIIS